MNPAAAAPEPTPHRFRCGDTVRHNPSDEEWVVAYADYDRGDLAWSGWPDGYAKVVDCALVDACTDEEHEKAVDEWEATLPCSRRWRVLQLYRPAALISACRRDAVSAMNRAGGAITALRGAYRRADVLGAPRERALCVARELLGYATELVSEAVTFSEEELRARAAVREP